MRKSSLHFSFAIVLALLVTIAPLRSHAQKHGPMASNSLFLEILGNGGLYSVNYDRLLDPDMSLRLGFSYIGLSASSPDDASSASVSLMMIPIMFNYFIASHENGVVGSSKLELGAGPVLVNLSGSVTDGVGSTFSGGGMSVAGTATIGYRYQPIDGGFLFRVGFTPIFGSGGFLPWGGISFGASF